MAQAIPIFVGPTKSEFESRVAMIPIAGCWIWMKALGAGKPSHRYGNLRIKGKTYCSHRYAWTLYKGPIDKGLHVLHRCDVTECCNPEHLFLGTNLDNIKDSSSKGRRNTPRNRPSGLTYSWNPEAKAAWIAKKTTISDATKAKCRELRLSGYSYQKIADLVGVSFATARRSVLGVR